VTDTLFIDASDTTLYPTIQDAINAAASNATSAPIAVVLPDGVTSIAAELQIPLLTQPSYPITLIGRRARSFDQPDAGGTTLVASASMRSVLAILSAQHRIQDVVFNAAGQATYGLFLQNVYGSQFDNVTAENAIYDGWYFTADNPEASEVNNDSVLMNNCWAQQNGTMYVTAGLQGVYPALPGTLKVINGTASITSSSPTITFSGVPDLTTLVPAPRPDDFVRIGGTNGDPSFYGKIASITANTITLQGDLLPQSPGASEDFALFVGFGVNLTNAQDNNILVVTGGQYRFNAASNFNVQGLFGSTFIGPEFIGSYFAGFSVSRTIGTSIGQGTMLQNCYFEENQAAEVWADNYTDVTIVSPMFESVNPPYKIRPEVLTSAPAQGVVVSNGLRTVLPSGTEQNFVFELRNDNGTLQHRFVSDFGTGGVPAGASQINNAVNTWTATPQVGPTTALAAGAGIVQNAIVFDTADQPPAPWFLPPAASVEVCSLGSACPSVYVSQMSSDIDGATTNRLILGCVTATGGQPFVLTTDSIPAGTQISIRLAGGYIRGMLVNPLAPS
jgi:hypothetical protein